MVEETIEQKIEQGQLDDDDFYKKLNEETGDAVQPYHKYIAVVNADGDNFGKYVQNLKADKQKLREFSEELIKYGKKAKDLIEAYGGASVYIGGDDLLFFAPVVSRDTDGQRKTIFDLIRALDNCFYDHFPPDRTPLSLSYGISFTYYKYPLNEALLESYGLLQQVKENGTHQDKKKHPNKNAIAFKVLKHSGQFFEAVIDKAKPDKQAGEWKYPGESLYQQFSELVSGEIEKEGFINSLTHNMAFFQELFGELLLNVVDETEVEKGEHAIDQLFENNLNESIHKEAANKKFIQQVVAFIKTVYAHLRKVPDEAYTDEQGNSTPHQLKSEDALKIIYSALRFVHFVRSTNQNKPKQHV
ncbi:MAG: type III-B CRISPR-associated protein Cas10/Cmr2 [Bacteroidetes bacterium]|nr:MAG: type III-B CRISPR-associated protein Cas10/Cmr2 [Bacteroidota bacterium]